MSSRASREQPDGWSIVPLTSATGGIALDEEVRMITRIFAVALLSATLLVAACNTVEGAGKDVSSAGKAVSNAAADAK
jgi:predicted small secreted protein